MTPCSANHSAEAEILNILSKNTSDAVIWMNQDGVILHVNETLLTLSGHPGEYFIGRPFGRFFGVQMLHELNRSKVYVRDVNERELELEMTIAPVEHEGERIGILAIARLSKPERLQEQVLMRQIRQLTYYDSLTGLPNLNKFKEVWRHLQNNASAESTSAIVLLDLDRFGIVNHYAGYDRGDDFLIAVSQRLTSIIRQEDPVFRWSSDRFLILLQDVNKQQVRQIAERILEQFQLPFVVKQMEISITPSLGITMSPEDGEDVDMLLNNASTATYYAKETGKNSYRFYSRNMDSGASLALEQQLRKALERKEFVLHYQPKVDIAHGEVVGVEALLRWNHPEFGLVPPNQFIPLAEESGLIVPIGEWVLETACLQNKAWQMAGIPPVVMSVNLSPRQFKDGNIVQKVKQSLDKSGLSAEFLELELTESMMLDMNYAAETLAQLKMLGVRTSLDDFGKGYSSLTYLKSLPLDILKVDSSFVRHCTDNEQDAVLLKTIINMGQNLEMTVVAEGVEEEGQLEVLKTFGCHQAQGFLLSKPVPGEAIPSVISGIRTRFQAET
ncbi:putative bifunctional diguanylate cyclase/phosphodiesterase [Paenibacillus physcomitrellae]|uniref:Diguanylate cyclase n=1 Tax=Paenibacillus physcomitrellae TaxID=1619311 RepID=A0ABQ1FNE5_9BACL|nr:GGDEF and EAL domain-containing protein [Paenibacillus physcomitrellae]GGA23934.1 hypothetical protein GCM10010917_05890 [Paenibacillus physcomitrellae]